VITQRLKQINIFDSIPKQLYPSEPAEKGKVVVIVPEPQSKLVEWFLPKKNWTQTRVKLDILESFVWDSCNGTMTVKDIADKMKQDYGSFAEPVDVRVRSYITRLHTKRFIDVSMKNKSKPQLYQKIK